MHSLLTFLSEKWGAVSDWFTDRALRAHLIEEEPEDENLAAVVRKRNSRSVMLLRTILIAAVIAVAVTAVKYVSDHRTYSGYEVIEGVEKTDNVSEYASVGTNVLRYSSDGAALETSAMDTIWNVSYSMTDPESDISGKSVVIYDKLGTAVYIFDESGQTGTFDTGEPIAKARVSGQGNVAVLLDENTSPVIRYYARSGSEIASVSTSVSDYGIPMDMALSEDGLRMAVSYLTPSGNSVTSNVVLYDFSDASDVDGTEAASFSFEGKIVPALVRLDGGRLAAVRDDGYTVINTGGDPAEAYSEDLDGEIASVFSDGTHLGFVCRSEKTGHKFEMHIYNVSGKETATAYVDLNYDHVRLAGGQVLFFNSSELAVYSPEGVCRFSGTLSEGAIADVLKIEANRYLLMTDQTTETIRLTR